MNNKELSALALKPKQGVSHKIMSKEIIEEKKIAS